MHVGQAPVDSVVAERQPGVIDAQEVKDGGVHIVAVRDVVDGFVRSFVGGSMPERTQTPQSWHQSCRGEDVDHDAEAHPQSLRPAARM